MIDEYRKFIDILDNEIAMLFAERMKLCGDIALLKKENSIEISDKKREDEIIERLTEKSDISLKPYIKELYTKIFELSKDYQTRKVN